MSYLRRITDPTGLGSISSEDSGIGDPGLGHIENLLINLHDKMTAQDEKLENIQRSFCILEADVRKRLKAEAEYRRGLSVTMTHILEKIKDTSGNEINQSEPDSGLEGTISDADEIQNYKAQNDCDNSSSDRPSNETTSGFDNEREETIQRLKKEKQHLLDENVFMQNKLCRPVDNVHGSLNDLKAHVIKIDGGSYFRNPPKETSASLDDIRKPLGQTKKSAGVGSQNLRRSLPSKSGIVIDRRLSLPSNTKRVIDNTSTDDAKPYLHKVEEIPPSEILVCLKKYIDLKNKELQEKIDSAKTEIRRDILEIKQALQIANNNEDSKTKELKGKIDQTKTMLQREMAEVKKSVTSDLRAVIKAEALVSGASLANAVDMSGDGIKAELANVHKQIAFGVHFDIEKNIHDLKGIMKILKKSVLQSEESVKQELALVHGGMVEKLDTDMNRQITAFNTNLNKAVESSTQVLQRQMSKTGKDWFQAVSVSMDRQMQIVRKGLSDIIAAEAKLTRDCCVTPEGNLTQKYEFYFRIPNFELHVSTGVWVWSCPWFVPQFDTWVTSFAYFDTKGFIKIRLFNGRYPKVEGQTSSRTPKECLRYQMLLVDVCNVDRMWKVEDTVYPTLDEATKAIEPAKSKPKSGDFSCDKLKSEGFIQQNELVVKYVINF